MLEWEVEEDGVHWFFQFQRHFQDWGMYKVGQFLDIINVARFQATKEATYCQERIKRVISFCISLCAKDINLFYVHEV